jgi:hypothetical protein
MSELASESTGTASARAGTVPRRGITLESRRLATVRSEWIKFRSVRSGPVALVATALTVVAGAWLLGAGNRGSTVCYMTAAGLIGLFTGVLVRSAAAAITSVFGLLLVLPLLADRITPDAVTRHTVPYLPLNLGGEMLHHHPGLSPGAAVAGLAAWVLVLAAAAAFSLRGRDA